MASVGRALILAGAILLVAGLVVLFLMRFNLPLGRLPGDIYIQRENFSLHIPLATCLLLSVILTLIVNVLLRLLGRK